MEENQEKRNETMAFLMEWKRFERGCHRYSKIQNQINQKFIRDNKKKAHKEATTRLATEQSKAKGKSAQKLVDEVNAKYGTALAKRTILDYVKHDFIGTSK